MTSQDQWFKMPVSIVFNPAVTNLPSETFRVYVHLLTAFAHKKVTTLTETQFLPYTPVRSWRPHVRKLVDAGLVQWDEVRCVLNIPAFTELNSAWIASPTQGERRTVRTVKKHPRAALPKADLSYEYDCEYVSSEW